MLKRPKGFSAIPVEVFVALGVVCVFIFWLVMGLATYAGVIELWPALPTPWAMTLAVLAPPIYMLGVGIVCAIRDQQHAD